MRRIIYQPCLALIFALTLCAAARAQVTTRPLPSPKIDLLGIDPNSTGSDGQTYTAISIKVPNWKSYNATLFERSPDLPPCGGNNLAARTWLTFHGSAASQMTKPIYAFCAIGGPDEMQKLTFNVKKEEMPDILILVMEDRRGGKKYTSNCLNLKTGRDCEFKVAGGEVSPVTPTYDKKGKPE